jgi:hypothetical protein
MRPVLLALALLSSCGGRIVCPLGEPAPCTFPAGIGCQAHSQPATYWECAESADVSWIVFPDATAWRETFDAKGNLAEIRTCNLECAPPDFLESP